jgi:hypothetical protein
MLLGLLASSLREREAGGGEAAPESEPCRGVACEVRALDLLLRSTVRVGLTSSGMSRRRLRYYEEERDRCR